MATALDFNRRVADAARNQSLRGLRPSAGRARWLHKWRVEAQRDPRDRESRRWLIDVGDGCVNGTPALLGDSPSWRRKGLLSVTTPLGKELGSFDRITFDDLPEDLQRPSMRERELYCTSVTVSGVVPVLPDSVFFDLPVLPPATTLVGLLAELTFREVLASLALDARFPLLQLRPPFVVRAGRAPVNLDRQPVTRLAWLYLARPRGGKPGADAIFPQQVCFWNLAAYSTLEDQGILQLIPVLQATGEIGALTGLQLFEMLINVAKAVRWWSV